MTGQKLVPMTTAGCYVPGGESRHTVSVVVYVRADSRWALPGRFSHVSSAIMSVTTARVAGVNNVVACSPPMAGTDRVHPATLNAMHLAGADHILAMGGVQGVASMAFVNRRLSASISTGVNKASSCSAVGLTDSVAASFDYNIMQ